MAHHEHVVETRTGFDFAVTTVGGSLLCGVIVALLFRDFTAAAATTSVLAVSALVVWLRFRPTETIWIEASSICRRNWRGTIKLPASDLYGVDFSTPPHGDECFHLYGPEGDILIGSGPENAELLEAIYALIRRQPRSPRMSEATRRRVLARR